MIKYSLVCKNCNLTFNSWFASSIEYERLKKKKLLNCHNCNSIKVEKDLMAPQLMGKNSNNISKKELHKFKNIKNKLKEYQNFIKSNFKYVGENFAYEARSIHYDKKKKEKGIYGTASKKDLKELKDEGIDAQMIPWVKDKIN